MTPLNKTFVLGVALLALSSCDMYVPTHVNENRIQVVEEGISETIPASEITNERIAAVVNDYNNHGGSPMDVVVTYDPKSYRNTAMIASDQAVRITKMMRSQGVHDINSSILPVNEQGDESQVMITYHAVTANAPEGCTDMPGLNGHDLESNEVYKLGCGVDTLLAKQVARPNDLLGTSNSDAYTDGRAASNVVDLYRTGVRNEPLTGETASED